MITRYSKNQIMVVVLKADMKDLQVVTDRIQHKWDSQGENAKCELSYEMNHIPVL